MNGDDGQFSPISYSAAHILDSEPDAPTNKPVARLAIYALTRRAPGLKLFDIKCAWFNEDEFFPRKLLVRSLVGYPHLGEIIRG